MDCWGVLELERDADERSIKRQYARLLKTNRPDDDPAAFQALRTAYEQALDRARSRVKDDENDDPDDVETVDAWSVESSVQQPVLEIAPAERTMPSLEKVETVVRPAVEISWYEQARLTTPQNLESQHELARDQGYDEEFQQHLVKRCLLEPDEHFELIHIAVDRLQWLTPWQTVTLRPHQTQRLTQALLDSTLPTMRALLAGHQEREFLDTLKSLEQQPWLSSLDQHDQLEHWTMTLLLNTDDWSASLFERISGLFNWDQKHDVHSGTPSLWMHLIERCEKKEFVRRQRQLLASPLDSSAACAAHLILEPAPIREQLRIARNCDDSVWEDCNRLAFDLSQRHSDLIELFPNADLYGWQKRRDQLAFSPYARIYIASVGLGLTALYSQAPNGKAVWEDVFFSFVTVPILMMLAFYIGLSIWRPVKQWMKPLDLRLSERLLPEALSWPGYQAMILGHGIPVAVFGSIYARAGPGPLAIYVAVLLAWIYLSPYRLSLIRDAIRAKTGGWERLKGVASMNIGKWVMLLLGLMFAFVIAVIVFGPGPAR
ncbi:molecular chaperone DnaJ [Pseudomonas syringae]|uniref:molecular chaperone DnaJ n=1 Tax=Pseudomonas syringae TaxID=317 RepID=UPI001F3BBF7B|nr:molecular chaperone DnaJ [Pseudomonas syringae]MCF5709023.1 molecular chaperone DnaJ [Pseudomonas syringae]